MSELISPERFRIAPSRISYTPWRVSWLLRRQLQELYTEWRFSDAEVAAWCQALLADASDFASDVRSDSAPGSETGGHSEPMELTSRQVADRLHKSPRRVVQLATQLGGRFDDRTHRWWFRSDIVAEYEETHG